MKMRKFIAMSLAAVFAGAAFAASVTLDEAAFAARRWATAGEVLGARLGMTVKTSALSTIAVDGDVKVYAVPFEEGGVAFTSSDTRMEPIVAFTATSDVDLSETSPLTVLLKKDALLRSKLLDALARDKAASTSASAASAAAAQARCDEAEAKWAELLAADGNASTAGSALASDSEKPLDSVSDVRVFPLVKSKWSQMGVGSLDFYNYYTPGNYPCGCTATAAAQVMRYFTYPVEEISSAEFSCKVDGISKNLATIGGLYEWEKMPYEPTKGAGEENAQAVGKLMYDIGVALRSDYASGGTGALPYDVARMMRATFGYASAYSFWSEDALETGTGGLHVLSVREKIVYSNLDAGKPVQLAIYGYDGAGEWGGHAVVADGYGYNSVGGEETAYVHINMGWGGIDDMWYNIPEIDAANTGANYDSAATTYSYMAGAAFNVDPRQSGLEIFSGTVFDAYGDTVAGAEVRLECEDGSVTNTLTDARGIYFFEVPGNLGYVASTSSEDGTYVAATEEVYLPRTVANSDYVLYSESQVGNSWGNDLTLDTPVAEVDGTVYATLELAFDAAREAASGAVVKLLKNVELRQPQSIDFPCVVTSAGADPAATAVTRTDDAGFTVVAGGELLLSNVVFAAGNGTVVDVEEGGNLTVAGKVDFGVADSVAAVVTADAAGFAIAGALSVGFTLDCKAALEIPNVFGSVYNLDKDAAAAAAAFVANYNDDTLEVRGAVEGDAAPFALKWDEVPVPVDAASCYYVTADGVTNTSARISRLFARLPSPVAGGEIVVRRSETLSVPLTFDGDVTIRGEDGVVLTMAAPEDGFENAFEVVGGRLVVSDLTFEGFEGGALFMVDGGELELLDGAVIDGAVGNDYYSGAVSVMSGTATIGEGAEIVNCSIMNPYGEGCGGGAYVAGGATLKLYGCRITGCTGSAAGGVYADRGGSTVRLKGDLVVSGNFDDYDIPSDIFAANSKVQIIADGAVNGEVGIVYSGTGNQQGQKFADVAEGLPASELAALARWATSFYSDVTEDLEGTLAQDGATLVWKSSEETSEVPDGFLDWAVARVVLPSGTALSYWSVADALQSATNAGATVELLLDDVLDEYVVPGATPVTLTSGAAGGVAAVTGGTIIVPKATEFVLKDIVLSGEDMLEIDGGKVVLAGAVDGEIGTSGSMSSDTNLFGRVSAALEYDTLTNSAAAFVNAGIGAYGMAVTNASETLLAWSTAIASDGSYTDAKGNVWYCVGEIPVSETEVHPGPIAFSSIVYDASADEYRLTLTNLTAGCWYSLYAVDSLAGGFVIEDGVTEPVTNFQAEVDGEFEFTVPAEGASMFWKATGESGTVLK